MNEKPIWKQVNNDANRTVIWVVLVCLTLTIALACFGCQSQTRTTPATSRADRQVDEKRGGTTFRVIVEPITPPGPKATVTP